MQSGVFGVNVLAEHQGDIAYKFAKKGEDKFAGVDTLRGRTGIHSSNVLAHFECEVEETVTGGTHSVFLARVKEASGTDAPPLTYFRGRFGRLENARDDAAYRSLRERVIERTLPVGDVLDIDQLAAELDVEAPHVYYALTKLAADNLVARTREGYVVNALTADRAAQLFDARCTIQIGVLEQTVGSAGDEALDELQRRAEDFARTARGEAPDLTAFLRASHTFHQHLIALAGCPQLSESYERLGIPAFWTRTLAEWRWWEEWDLTHHAELVQAYRAGDVGAAKRLVCRHRDWVKGVAVNLITARGRRGVTSTLSGAASPRAARGTGRGTAGRTGTGAGTPTAWRCR